MSYNTISVLAQQLAEEMRKEGPVEWGCLIKAIENLSDEAHDLAQKKHAAQAEAVRKRTRDVRHAAFVSAAKEKGIGSVTATALWEALEVPAAE